MAGNLEWVLLAYRVPREPSTPRITVWRKLKRLGVAQVVDGLVALPLDARTKERLEWLGDEIAEAGGEATIWTARLGSVRQERELATRMADTVAAEYRAVVDAAAEVASAPAPVRRRTLARLRRELRRVGQRDYFPPPERAAARTAVDALASAIEVTA
jgi:Protein ChrB, N-terminal